MTIKKVIDVWKYVLGDKYNLDDLYDIQKFLEDDLERAYHELDKADKYEKYGVPGWRWYKIQCEAEVEESLANLEVVKVAIKDNLKRLETEPLERRS